MFKGEGLLVSFGGGLMILVIVVLMDARSISSSIAPLECDPLSNSLPLSETSNIDGRPSLEARQIGRAHV